MATLSNGQIAETLDLLADLMEFQGESGFRVRAYRNGSRALRDLSESVVTILADQERRLTDIDGIGKGIAEKTRELVETGRLSQLEKLRAKVPESVLALLRIPNLGPKRAKILYDELHIASLDQLKAACEAGKVRELKGFGEKTEQSILAGMDVAESANQRIYWKTADEIVQTLRKHLERCDAIKQFEFAGSYRRGRETVGDLDVLVVSQDHLAVMDHFAAFPAATDVLARGETKMSIRIASGLQVDLRVVPQESFGAALQYFTGSKEHNVELRGRARQRKLKINEYGVFRVEDNERIAGETEEGVYATLDLPWFPPELRENRREFEWADARSLPSLIELGDIRGDLHMHTTATDGKSSVEEMARAARKRGMRYIAITDHSKRWMTRGMDRDRLYRQWEEIDEVNETLKGKIHVLKGVECDSLEKGDLDLDDELLEEADWVLVSIHYGQQQPREQIMKRLRTALDNPHVHAIGHPTGRLINRREPYDLDPDELIGRAKERGKILELNANPARLDLNDTLCAAAQAAGVPIVISTDAHSIEGMSVMRYGIMQARRAGLTKADVVNTRTWAQFRKTVLGQK